MDNELVNAKQVEVQMRFAVAAAKVLGITALDLAQHADNEPNMQMLVEHKAIIFGNRYNENRDDVEAIREFSQKRADAIRETGQSESGTDGAWYSDLDTVKIPA